MKRFLQDHAHMLGQAKRFKTAYCHRGEGEVPEWVWNLGYWRKSKALGCRRTGCWCKRDKILGVKTRRNLVSDLREMEALAFSAKTINAIQLS